MFIDKLPGTDSALETRELVNKLIFEILETIELYFDDINGESEEEHAESIIKDYKEELVLRSPKNEVRIPQVKLLQTTIKDYLYENNIAMFTREFIDIKQDAIAEIEKMIYKVLKDFADDKN